MVRFAKVSGSLQIGRTGWFVITVINTFIDIGSTSTIGGMLVNCLFLHCHILQQKHPTAGYKGCNEQNDLLHY